MRLTTDRKLATFTMESFHRRPFPCSLSFVTKEFIEIVDYLTGGGKARDVSIIKTDSFVFSSVTRTSRWETCPGTTDVVPTAACALVLACRPTPSRHAPCHEGYYAKTRLACFLRIFLWFGLLFQWKMQTRFLSSCFLSFSFFHFCCFLDILRLRIQRILHFFCWAN